MNNKAELEELRRLQKDITRFFSKTEFERLKDLENLDRGNRL